MKKIISIYGIMGSLLIAMLPGVSSCDKLEDELFKKNTYIIHNGWQDYSLEVADSYTCPHYTHPAYPGQLPSLYEFPYHFPMFHLLRNIQEVR